MVAFALSDPAAPGLILGVPKVFSRDDFQRALLMLPRLIDGAVA